MNRLFRAGALALASALLATACGGGSDPAAPSTTVTGTVYAGEVTGAQVVVKDAAGQVVAGPVTSAAGGAFSIAIPDTRLAEVLRFEATGGSVVDDASGATVAGALRLSVRKAAGVLFQGAKVNLDPATTIEDGATTANGGDAAGARSAFVNVFAYDPEQPVAPSSSAAAGVEARRASLRAGAFSWLTRSIFASNPEKQFDLLAAIGKDLGDGKVDGKDAAGALLSIDGTTALPLTYQYAYATALGACGAAEPALGLTATSHRLDSYVIEYLPGVVPAQVGKTSFQLRVSNTADGSPATGKTITLTPRMHMPTMWHGSPVGQVVESATPGTYDATMYYLMASGPTMGFWALGVTVAGGTAEGTTFNPPVAMAMGTTTMARLYGVADTIAGSMGSPTPQVRGYQLFLEGLTGMDVKTLALHITGVDDPMKTIFTSMGVGAVLHGATGSAWSVETITVEGSSDGGATWQAGTGAADGLWTIPGLAGLAAGGTIQVRMVVNGETKTGANGTPLYAPITVLTAM